MGVTLGVLGSGRTKRQGLREGEEDEDGAEKDGENNPKTMLYIQRMQAHFIYWSETETFHQTKCNHN